MLFSTILLSSFLFQASQLPPLTCSQVIGDVVLEKAQQIQQQQQTIIDLRQQLAAAQAELAKLKEAK